ncbi:hypothetical protein D9M68_454740 [compost metagenome]
MERTRIVPFKVSFDLVKTIDKYLNWLLYFVLFLGIIVLILSKCEVEKNNTYAENINYIIGVLSLVFFLVDLLKRFLLQLAEQRRRKDFIDNSLDTNLSDFRSEGYYSNDSIDPGIHKMGVNCFENSFFSMNISKRMIAGLTIQCAIVFVIFWLLLMSTDKVTIATFLQFALPYTIIQQLVIVIIYYFQMESIFNYFKLLFGSAQEQKKDLLIIHNVINYESTISWAGVVLDDKTFKNNNDMLSEKWDEIKKSHNLT